MQRCLQLAQFGSGTVAPNPLVGAVLVHNNTIVGEGYHKQYGQAHAEVNCINNVLESNKTLIEKSTLYVSLEPCAHFGKTPPCTNFILAHKIKKVVIGCADTFEQVNGRGIQQLKENGVEVVFGVLQKECKEINKRFFTYHSQKRPYIILKWAVSANNKMAANNNKRVLISNDFTNRLVHKWRTQEAAIMVGTITALKDNPLLTARLWKGKSPIRILLDRNLVVPTTNSLFNTDAKTIVFNSLKNEEIKNIQYVKLTNFNLTTIANAIHTLRIQSVMVEGGAKLLQSFINAGLFDEIRVIENEELHIEDGLEAPIVPDIHLSKKEKYLSDTICYYNVI